MENLKILAQLCEVWLGLYSNDRRKIPFDLASAYDLVSFSEVWVRLGVRVKVRVKVLTKLQP